MNKQDYIEGHCYYLCDKLVHNNLQIIKIIKEKIQPLKKIRFCLFFILVYKVYWSSPPS